MRRQVLRIAAGANRLSAIIALRAIGAGFVLFCAAIISAYGPALATETPSGYALYMIERDGCIECARWNAEIGGIYDKTEFGEIAPLTRLDILAKAPAGIAFDRRIRFTPTFVLVRDGAEVGRIEGHPGDEYFWFLLEKLIDTAE